MTAPRFMQNLLGTSGNLLIASGTVWIFVEIVYFYGDDRLLKLQLEPFIIITGHATTLYVNATSSNYN